MHKPSTEIDLISQRRTFVDSTMMSMAEVLMQFGFGKCIA